MGMAFSTMKFSVFLSVVLTIIIIGYAQSGDSSRSYEVSLGKDLYVGRLNHMSPSSLNETFRNQILNSSDTLNTTSKSIGKSDTTASGAFDFANSKYKFSLFQEFDGSESDPDGIPNRYLEMQRNKRDAAKKAMEATLKWRTENEIDTILARPHDKFDLCKKIFPLYFLGRDKTNHVVLLQRPGLIDLNVAKSNGVTGEDLLYHYVYVMEYLWQILEPKADATMTSVIDLDGINFSLLRQPDLVSITQKFCSTMDAHFPQRAHKTLLINAPMWFGAIFTLISPLLRESTKQNIMILSGGKKQKDVLESFLSELPFSNNGLVKINPMEDDLRQFCLARLEESQIQMKEFIV